MIRISLRWNGRLFAMAAWSLFLGGAAWWFVVADKADFTQAARLYARACYEKDLIFRRWVAHFGGVYAPISDECAPNPYLDAPDRDITTPSGQRLTLVNSAYMIRQLYKRGLQEKGITTRVTSLDPRNQENVPDAWERTALEDFECGAEESTAFVMRDDQRIVRLIRPMVFEASCVKCHADEGYRVGEVCGGISVGVPIDTLWASHAAGLRSGLAAYGGIWLVGMLGIVFVDRTLVRRRMEREAAMAALCESEEQSRLTLTNLTSAFALHETIDRDDGGPVDYRYLAVNPAFTELTGAANPTGKTVREIFPDIQEDWINIYQKVVETGEPARFEKYNYRADQWWSMVAYRVRPNQFASIFYDVTERKRADDELLRAKAELQQYTASLESSNQTLEDLNHRAQAATRAKSDFLANMSHEIRTPMTAILGYTDLLLGEDGIENIPEHQRQAFDIIKRNGEHLLGLINGILDLSKVEAGQMQIEPTRCSPVQLVAEVVSLMRVRADAKGLKLRADLTPPLPETVFTDPLRTRQVLVNLVGNAIKFTDQGEICLGVRLASDHGRPRLRFDVSDTGIGIEAEHLAAIFEPFTQVDNSSARKFGGTGLGLCISKHLAKALHGDIEVRSQRGKGSVFSLTLDPGPLDGIPMIENTQEALLDRRRTAVAAAAKKIDLDGRILLAEDGPDNQRLISFLLKKAGSAVVVVENGQLACEEALAAQTRGEPFGVILMDMQMPVMDGYAATRRLREHGYAGPIIALTAHAMAEDRQKCLDAGCDDYATKPIDKQKLLAVVACWTDRGRASVTLSCAHPESKAATR